MDPIPSSEILTNVKTRYEYEIIMSEIDDLQQSLFRTKTKSFEELLKKVSVYTSSVVKAVASDHKIPLKSRDSVKDLLHNIKEALEKARFVKLTIAFEPVGEFIDKLHDWVVQNLGEGFVLDITTDSDIIGGIVLVHEGRYVDKSLIRLFEKKEEELKREVASFNLGNK